jgi:predicted nucleotidyltransferase
MLAQYGFIDKLKALPFIEKIWLFGSRARGDNQERADIDLAIVCGAATESNWLQVMEIIENSDTLLHIDCVRFEKSLISDDLYKNILKDKKVVYERSVLER